MKPNPARPRVMLAVTLGIALSSAPRVLAESLAVVTSGQPAAAKITGAPWTSEDHGLTAEGTGRLLLAAKQIGSGDFRVKARLTLAKLEGTAASFSFADSQFGFDGRGGTLFAEGRLFKDSAKSLGKTTDVLKAGEAFDFETVRKQGVTRFLVNGRELLRKEGWNGPAGHVGFRPWRNRMSVESFTVEGNLVDPPPLPAPLFLSGSVGGKDGYHTFRIPALATTTKGTVLAFCEGRKNSSGDSGNIDLLVKRSTDHGKTWSKLQVIWDDQGNTCGNPCAVVDQTTGAVWLLSTWNRGDDHEGEIIARKSKDTRRVFALRSDDDGITWSQPAQITEQVKKPDWTWYATGPGSGIQVENGPNKGRLVIPCDHIEAPNNHYYSHIIFSDDHGKTWQLGGRTPDHKVNECAVVELTGGKLMLNMRNYDRSRQTRQTAVSPDGGLTWRDQKHDPALVEPICQAAAERHRWPAANQPGVILFSNPASAGGRVRMTLRASFDDAVTWPVSKLLFEGPAGYSDLATLANGRVACLWEGGQNNLAESIIFSTVSLDELRPAKQLDIPQP